MHVASVSQALSLADLGEEMHGLVRQLYPICRSITGNGVRDTLRELQGLIPLEIKEVPSGTPVLDWVVPKEWNVRDAYVKDASGRRVIDFRESNLHVVSYSTPVATKLQLRELRPKLHALPQHPDWIPYRASFYREDWGFCLSQRKLDTLVEGEYEVVIDATLEDGHLTYGELVIPGELKEEVMLSAHVCHPSLCNDNLSGIAVATVLARYLATTRPRYTHRFVFAPATIGAITWLALNQDRVGNIAHGLVLTLLGDSGPHTYKRSRRGNAAIDRAAAYVLSKKGAPYTLRDFIPYGYDERQYCSPGFDLPFGCLMRTPYAEFPQYHTSADNTDFVRPEALYDSLDTCLGILDIVNSDRRYMNLNPRGEPQLGRRGIYRALAERSSDAAADRSSRELAMLWVLNQSDGHHSLLDIAERSGISFTAIRDAANLLETSGLLREA